MALGIHVDQSQDYPEVETIVYAVKNGLKVKEISINMNKRQSGKSSITPINSNKIARVFENIIENTVKYNVEGSNVNIKKIFI